RSTPRTASTVLFFPPLYVFTSPAASTAGPVTWSTLVSPPRLSLLRPYGKAKLIRRADSAREQVHGDLEHVRPWSSRAGRRRVAGVDGASRTRRGPVAQTT